MPPPPTLLRPNPRTRVAPRPTNTQSGQPCRLSPRSCSPCPVLLGRRHLAGVGPPGTPHLPPCPVNPPFHPYHPHSSPDAAKGIPHTVGCMGEGGMQPDYCPIRAPPRRGRPCSCERADREGGTRHREEPQKGPRPLETHPRAAAAWDASGNFCRFSPPPPPQGAALLPSPPQGQWPPQGHSWQGTSGGGAGELNALADAPASASGEAAKPACGGERGASTLRGGGGRESRWVGTGRVGRSPGGHHSLCRFIRPCTPCTGPEFSLAQIHQSAAAPLVLSASSSEGEGGSPVIHSMRPLRSAGLRGG